MPVSTNVKNFANKFKEFYGHGCIQYNMSIELCKSS